MGMNGDKGDKTLILPISLIPSYLHIPLAQFRILQVPPMIMNYQKNSGYSPYHRKGRVVNLCQCPRPRCKNHKEGSNKGYSNYFVDHSPEQGGHPGYRCGTDLLFIYEDNCLGLGEDPSQG